MTPAQWLAVDILIYAVPTSILLLATFINGRRKRQGCHNNYGDDSKLRYCPVCKRALAEDSEQRHADHPGDENCRIASDPQVNGEVLDQVHGGSISSIGS